MCVLKQKKRVCKYKQCYNRFHCIYLIKRKKNLLSFIDNVAIEVESKSEKENCKLLIEIVQNVFSWIDPNAVKFDDKKFKLIHFESSNTSSTNTVELPNNTILKSKLDLKWLEIYMNKKLNFKKHVQNRIASANRVLHLINRLQNSE